MYQMTATGFLTILALILLSCDSNGGEEVRLPVEDAQELGTRYTGWFYSGQLDSLIGRFADRDYTLADLRDFRRTIDAQLGVEVEVLCEVPHGKWVDEGAACWYGYLRHSRFSKTERPVRTSFGFDRDGIIFVFEVQTLPFEAETDYLDYRTKTRLRLPFEGEWYTSWGGHTIDLNQHTVAPDQRFAYDFLVKKDGYTFRGEGSDNEDYYCYEMEILAPADGIVVHVLDTVPENRMSEMPPVSGNTVVIDHGNGEFSVLGHLKYRTIVVEEGERVVSGQLLGYCGNSGHSSEPHLHYHLQNGPVPHRAEGLPAQFQMYQAEGRLVKRGEPKITQTVRHVGE